MTEKEFNKKWGWIHGDRTVLTEEQEKQFIKDYVSFMETKTQREQFFTDSDYVTTSDGKTCLKTYEGKTFEVFGVCTENETDPYWKTDIECQPMWKIRFPDGKEAKAYAEEIYQI